MLQAYRPGLQVYLCCLWLPSQCDSDGSLYNKEHSVPAKYICNKISTWKAQWHCVFFSANDCGSGSFNCRLILICAFSVFLVWVKFNIHLLSMMVSWKLRVLDAISSQIMSPLFYSNKFYTLLFKLFILHWTTLMNYTSVSNTS